MNKREAMRLARQEQILLSLGFTSEEADALRRISLTLHRWHEHECNGAIQRDEKTDVPYWHSTFDGRRSGRATDREAGAKKRLAAILARRNSEGDREDHANGGCTITRRASLSAYIQTDPRGAALYILRPGDIPAGGDADAYYSRGICVY